MEMKALRGIGLSESEIKVYFAMLELGSSTVGPLTKRADVQDSKIYSVLDKLKKKGLVSFVIKNNVKHFQAADPKNLLRILDERRKLIEEQESELRSRIIPQIELRKKLTEEKQEATVYESLEGLRSAFDFILDTLGKGEEYQAFVLGEALEDERLMGMLRAFHRKRIEGGIRARVISNEIFRGSVERIHRQKNMQVRYTKHKLPIGTFIFRNHVMKVIWEDKPTAFVIKSSKNYGYYKDFFEDIWKESKP